MKHIYHYTKYLDKRLKQLETEADKIGYDIDNDIYNNECCSIVTEADFKINGEGLAHIESTNFWKSYFMAVANMERT